MGAVSGMGRRFDESMQRLVTRTQELKEQEAKKDKFILELLLMLVELVNHMPSINWAEDRGVMKKWHYGRLRERLLEYFEKYK